MSQTITIYRPPTAQRFSCYLLYDRLLAIVLFQWLHLGMEQTTKYAYMRWISCPLHRIHDINANFIHLQEMAIRLPKMVRTEDSAGAASRSCGILQKCVLLHWRSCEHDRWFVSAITWSSGETLYEVATYSITFDRLTCNHSLALRQIWIIYLWLYL